MKTILTGVALALALASAGIAPAARADSFTYHGTLAAAGTPANGRYDLRLTLYSAEHGGSVVAGPVDLYAVEVLDGHFSAPVDFGMAAASPSPTWLAVAVKSGEGAWEALDGRSAVAPAGVSCPGSWTLDGNAGNPPGSYLGTADATPLRFKVNGVSSGIIDKGSGSTPNIVFGAFNDVLNPLYAVTIGGGANNTVDNTGSNDLGGGAGGAATIGGGWGNKATGNSATIAGGWSNTASGAAASIPGGYLNSASGNYSFAAGRNAKASHHGSLVWGSNETTDFASTAVGQFLVRSSGGVGINTATADNGTSPLNKTLTLAPASGSSSVSLSMRTSANHSWGFQNLVDAMLFGNVVNGNLSTALWFGTNATTIGVLGALPSTSKPFVVGTNSSTGNGAYLSPGGVWTNASSRFFKQGFAHIDAADVLAKLVAMPIQTWFYLDGQAEGRHLGPVAEDFASAFGLGNDSQHISTVDANGVALVAIQGLNSKFEDDNAHLRARLDSVQAENATLRERLDALTATVAHLAGAAE